MVATKLGGFSDKFPGLTDSAHDHGLVIVEVLPAHLPAVVNGFKTCGYTRWKQKVDVFDLDHGEEKTKEEKERQLQWLNRRARLRKTSATLVGEDKFFDLKIILGACVKDKTNAIKRASLYRDAISAAFFPKNSNQK